MNNIKNLEIARLNHEQTLNAQDSSALNHVSPLVIWGHSGSGKTTLINYLYEK